MPNGPPRAGRSRFGYGRRMSRALRLAAVISLGAVVPTAVATYGEGPFAAQGQSEHGGAFTIVVYHHSLATRRIYVAYLLHCVGGRLVRREREYEGFHTLSTRRWTDAHGVPHASSHARLERADGTEIHLATRMVFHRNGVTTMRGTFAVSATVGGRYCDTGV